jgi:hypothetical protein
LLGSSPRSRSAILTQGGSSAPRPRSRPRAARAWRRPPRRPPRHQSCRTPRIRVCASWFRLRWAPSWAAFTRSPRAPRHGHAGSNRHSCCRQRSDPSPTGTPALREDGHTGNDIGRRPRRRTRRRDNDPGNGEHAATHASSVHRSSFWSVIVPSIGLGPNLAIQRESLTVQTQLHRRVCAMSEPLLSPRRTRSSGLRSSRHVDHPAADRSGSMEAKCWPARVRKALPAGEMLVWFQASAVRR